MYTTPKPRMPSTLAGMQTKRTSPYEPSMPRPPAPTMRQGATGAGAIPGGAVVQDAGTRFGGAGRPPAKPPQRAQPSPSSVGIAPGVTALPGSASASTPPTGRVNPTPLNRHAQDDAPNAYMGQHTGDNEAPRTREQWEASIPSYMNYGGWSTDKRQPGLFEEDNRPTETTYDVRATMPGVENGMYTGVMSRVPSATTRLTSHAAAAEARRRLQEDLANAQRIAEAQRQSSRQTRPPTEDEIAAADEAERRAAVEAERLASANGSASGGAGGSSRSGAGTQSAALIAGPSPSDADDTPQEDLGNGVGGSPSVGASDGADTYTITSSRGSNMGNSGSNEFTINRGQIPVQTEDGYEGRSPSEIAARLREPPYNYSEAQANRAAGFLSSGGWTVDLESGSVYQILPDGSVGDFSEEWNIITTPPEGWAEAAGELGDTVERQWRRIDEENRAASGEKETDPRDRIADALNTPMPTFDQAGVDDLLRAQMRTDAYKKARAMHAAMEGAARAGASPEASIGVNAELQHGYDTGSSEREAQTRLALEQQHDQRVFQWAQQQRAIAAQAGLAEQAHRFSLIEQEAAARLQRRNAAAMQPSFGQQLGRGLLTAGIGMIPFVGSGLAAGAGALWDGFSNPGYSETPGYGGPMRSWYQTY